MSIMGYLQDTHATGATNNYLLGHGPAFDAEKRGIPIANPGERIGIGATPNAYNGSVIIDRAPIPLSSMNVQVRPVGVGDVVAQKAAEDIATIADITGAVFTEV